MINKLKINNLLRYFLGFVFLFAGIYRVFNWQNAIIEFSKFNFASAYYLITLVILVEIVGGLLLILNIRTKEILFIFSIFIVCAILGAFAINGKNIILNLKELFVFDSTPTDVFLHFTYLIILVYLWGKK
ncbi:MAG: DoxX family protein [Candidatus Staskawiczbacteria bacterium]|jgi:uncharacterized membrane protein YphA (DoxX/SURF4 family)